MSVWLKYMTQEEEWLLRDKYDGHPAEGFMRDVERLKDGEPLPYVIGWVNYFHAKIYLDSHPLIPRTETEFWMEKAIAEIRSRGSGPVRVLDLCAGSGCIGLAVLVNVPNALVDLIEIDEAHHPTIQKNLGANGIGPERASVLGGDLFEGASGSYDFILSNPPYIDPALDRLEPSVRKYEPRKSLYGGVHGTELIFRILRDVRQFLVDDGVLYIEHEPEQAAAIRAVCAMYAFDAETMHDQYGKDRFTRFVRKKA